MLMDDLAACARVAQDCVCPTCPPPPRPWKLAGLTFVVGITVGIWLHDEGMQWAERGPGVTVEPAQHDDDVATP